jgi:DNA-directed RNA polymerase specialized sigma24 family protein
MESSEMNLTELQCHCQCEMEKYSRYGSNTEEYCLEIFRRAMLLRDEQAWEILNQTFSSIILGWLRRHSCYTAAYRLHPEEKDYVTLTLERLWMVGVRNQTMEFRSLAGALSFLRISLNSVVIDTLREQGKEQPLTPETDFVEYPAPDEEESAELWECIKSMLPDKREQRLAYLLFYCNLTPRQVIHYCPQEFSNIQEVYQMKRIILDRLRRHKDRLRWLLTDEDL